MSKAMIDVDEMLGGNKGPESNRSVAGKCLARRRLWGCDYSAIEPSFARAESDGRGRSMSPAKKLHCVIKY